MAEIEVTDTSLFITHMDSLYEITATQGQGILDNMYTYIETLKTIWKGSDAKTNIKDLIGAYNAFAANAKLMEGRIIDINNGPVIALQKEIVASAGECTINSELSPIVREKDVIGPVDYPGTYVAPTFSTEAAKFNQFVKDCETFVSNMKEAKKNLFDNWLAGAGRDNYNTWFDGDIKSFEDNFLPPLKKVDTNMQTVIENKQSVSKES